MLLTSELFRSNWIYTTFW